MSEPRVTVATIAPQQPARLTTASVFQAMSLATHNVGVWAGDTAQQFGTLVAVLMGPAVFSAYAFAAWALAADLGWTDTFVFSVGALSNWLIWIGVAVLVHTAASVLKKHSRIE